MPTLLPVETCKIMCNLDKQSRDIVERQATVLRIAERDHDLTTARLAAETGISESTLRSYSTGTAMPLHNAVKLAAIIPDHLVSLWFEASGKVVLDRPGDEDAALAELLLEATGYAAEHVERFVDDGRHCHIDKAALKERARRVASVATRAAQ